MKISDELKQHCIDAFEKIREEKIEQIQRLTGIKSSFLEIPIVIDGVIDFVRYNVKEKRFDRLFINVSRDPEEEITYLGNAVLADRDKIETIGIII